MVATATKPTITVETPSLPPVDNLPAARVRTPGTSMAIIPQSWQEITAIAGAICRARMAPKSYCDKESNPLPDKVAVAIMHGMEVGMTPMASLQSIAVINGNPSLYGDGMLAVVRASGLLEDIKEYDEWDKEGPLTATCEVKRRGETTWGKTVVARVDCQKAGWWTKDGPWRATPHRMMQMRARGWALRDKFADVLRGLRSAEEMEDMVDVTPQGSATTGPVPAEPTREPAKAAQAAPPAGQQTGAAAVANNDEQTSAGTTPHSDPAESGQQGRADPAAGGHPPAAGQPAADPKKTEEIKPRTGRRTTKAKPITDVKDQNDKQPGPAPAETGQTTPAQDQGDATNPGPAEPAEPITFEAYNRPGDFFIFSDGWIQQKERTASELEQWHAFYGPYMKKLKEQGSQGTKDAVDDTLLIYGRVIAKLLPPQE